MIVLNYAICVLIGYLLGSSNMAYYVAKLKKVDLRKGGSGNLGTSNAVIMMGKGAGVIVLLHDVLKTVIAVLICKALFPALAYGCVIAGVAAVLGHIFPFYLKFKGGKGFASYIGLILALDWKFGLIMLLVIVVVSLIFDWIVAGTFATIGVSPIYFLFTINYIVCLMLLVGTAAIFLKHIENLHRKAQGKETGIQEALFKKKKTVQFE